MADRSQGPDAYSIYPGEAETTMPGGNCHGLQLTSIGEYYIADRADYAFGSFRYFPGRGRGFFAEIQYLTTKESLYAVNSASCASRSSALHCSSAAARSAMAP